MLHESKYLMMQTWSIDSLKKYCEIFHGVEGKIAMLYKCKMVKIPMLQQHNLLCQNMFA